MPQNNEQRDITFFKKSKELKKKLKEIDIQNYLLQRWKELEHNFTPDLKPAADIIFNSILSDKMRNEFNYEINRTAEENNNNPYLTNRRS